MPEDCQTGQNSKGSFVFEKKSLIIEQREQHPEIYGKKGKGRKQSKLRTLQRVI